jgi:hypothetical protein
MSINSDDELLCYQEILNQDNGALRATLIAAQHDFKRDNSKQVEILTNR